MGEKRVPMMHQNTEWEKNGSVIRGDKGEAIVCLHNDGEGDDILSHYVMSLIEADQRQGMNPSDPDIMINNASGEEMDLNDPKVYDPKHYLIVPADKYQGTTRELEEKCWTKIGFVFLYTHYLYPPTKEQPNRWKAQLPYIHAMLREYTARRQHHRKDTEENRMWFKKWLYRFDREVENMC